MKDRAVMLKPFHITLKPATENPERGWPLEKLLKLVRGCQAGERVIEPWFHIRSSFVSLAFVLGLGWTREGQSPGTWIRHRASCPSGKS